MAKAKVLPIFIPEAGCGLSCVYCNQSAITGRKLSFNEAEISHHVENMIKANAHQKDLEVAFYGGSFTGLSYTLQEKLLQVVQPWVKRGIIQSIRVSTRPDLIDDEKLNLLKNFGVKRIELGVQSMDDDVLTLVGRPYKATDVMKSAQLIRSFGFFLGLQMMIGLPGDDFKKTQTTAEKLVDLQPEGIRIYQTLVFEKTMLALWYRQGVYKPLSLEEAISQACWLYEFFIQKNLVIYKIGLHPGTYIANQTLLAGPYHPNFQQLVLSNYYWKRITPLLRKDMENFVMCRSNIFQAIVGFERKNLTQWEKLGYRVKVVFFTKNNSQKEYEVCHR